ncbi:TolC family protein [Pseudotamlana carrageenivorans]|uniref:Transporter n=1 Tax=Pseudotamlana carrageenivorans TaxID=2069432 RepID=A0A2I7SJN5_9FLAO|nr:TolC family protein [Tamlana carrageenivorans]AUS06064.1 transporter [Tamlana carrageenivorans]
MRRFILSLILVSTCHLYAQDSLSTISLAEYLGYVKSFHPIVKQANLILNESEAKLLKSRGAFDPKLEVDYGRKNFKGTEYYDKLNASFKIPTWYGIELKGNFEENTGQYLNPESSLPTDGLYSAGISVSLAKGLLINERMATLKQAKLFVNQAKADRLLLVNDIVYQASLSYFEWLKSYKEKRIYESFLNNAQERLDGIKTSFEVGERPAIDTVEARITLNTRKLNLEKAKIKYIKSTLELSNYLWLNENTPIELKDNIIPDVSTSNQIDAVFNTSNLNIENISLENHPKMLSLQNKYKSLEVEKRLKTNNLLPKIDLQYNFLSQTPDLIQSFNTANYKSYVNVSFPLFLRKERGDLQLAKMKLQNTSLDISATRVTLQNKINAVNQEIASYKVQTQHTSEIISDYKIMLNAEERKFSLGESSLFLVNSRESKLIDAELKGVSIEYDLLQTKAKLSNVLATDID